MAIKWLRRKNVVQNWFEHHFYIIIKGIKPKNEKKSMTKIPGDWESKLHEYNEDN